MVKHTPTRRPAPQAEFAELSNQLAAQYPDRARLHFAYDEPLSHLIYAGGRWETGNMGAEGYRWGGTAQPRNAGTAAADAE